MNRKSQTRRPAAAFSGLVAAMLAAGVAQAQNASNTLSTGKYITVPPVGTNTNSGSLTMNMVASPDGKWAVGTDMGFNQSLSVINTLNNTLTSSMTFGNPALGTNTDGLYYGLVFQQTPNNDGSYTLYASHGSAGYIGVYHLSTTGQLIQETNITLQHGEFPAGLALSSDGHYLYVADNEYYVLSHASATDTIDNVTAPGRLSVYDATTGNFLTQLDLNGKTAGSITVPTSIPTITTNSDSSSFPLAATVANGILYVTSQRDGVVYPLSLTNPTAPVLGTAIPVGLHPAGILANAAGTRVFVSNAHSDSVSIINTATNTVVGTINLVPSQTPKVNGKTLPGFTPLGMALAPNGATLYVAMGDMNAVAQVALNSTATSGTVMGYIPAGWYPTAVVAGPVKQLLIANAKGVQNRYPNPGYQQFVFNSDPQYDLNLIEGTVEETTLPGAQGLVNDTVAVLADNRITGNTNNTLPSQVLGLSGIKHVIYIIKENRTYDQVLGDIPQGNGDPALALFGANVTPNLHALAQRFVLLDNFYDCAEASGDGWPWSTQSLATEYVIKNLPYNYSDRGRNYDFEGQVNNYPVVGIPAPPNGGSAPVDIYGNPIIAPGTPFAGGAPAIADVSEAPNGHIWDDAVANGLSIRDYGFYETSGNGTFTYTTGSGNNQTYTTTGTGANEHFTYTFSPGSIPENQPAVPNLVPGGSIAAGTGGQIANFSLAGNTDIDFRKYDNAYPDSDAPYNDFLADGGFSNLPASSVYLYPKTAFGHYNEPSRFSEWNREFQLMIQQGMNDGNPDEKVPALMMVRFHHDHTSGLASNTHLPVAMVADNDYAVGQLVQAVSQSPIWKDTAIFVVEDDAQDGPDHVDCHRSTAYVISPWIKANTIDHTFYNTDSLLHTMELVLGLPSLSQYDAIATPIEDFDTAPNNNAVFNASPASPSIFSQIMTPVLISKNKGLAKLVAESDKMDFSEADDAPAQLLNQIIWQSVKGVGSVAPSPRRTIDPHTGARIKPGVKVAKTADKDDDND